MPNPIRHRPQPLRSRHRSAAPISDINVTPFVDVMLVLLVVFMITAPLLAPSIDVVQPSDEPPPPSDTPPERITIHHDNSQTLRGRAYATDKLVLHLKERTTGNPDLKIQIDPHCAAKLGVPWTLIAELIEGGIPEDQIELVIKPCTRAKES